MTKRQDCKSYFWKDPPYHPRKRHRTGCPPYGRKRESRPLAGSFNLCWPQERRAQNKAPPTCDVADMGPARTVHTEGGQHEDATLLEALFLSLSDMMG